MFFLASSSLFWVPGWQKTAHSGAQKRPEYAQNRDFNVFWCTWAGTIQFVRSPPLQALACRHAAYYAPMDRPNLNALQSLRQVMVQQYLKGPALPSQIAVRCCNFGD